MKFWAYNLVVSFILKKRINPYKMKLISTISVSGLLMLLVFILTSFTMNKALYSAEKKYFECCSETVEGYSEALYFYLENYHTALKSIYDPLLFSTGDTARIQDWLIKNKPYMPEDFAVYFYVDDKKTGYFSNGNIIGLEGRNYVDESNYIDSDFFVSNIMYSKLSSSPVFVIGIPYFDDNHSLKGILCAAFKIEVMQKITDAITLSEKKYVYLQDRTGRFLVHPDKSYLGEVFVPDDEHYKAINSEFISSQIQGRIETVNENDEVVNLIYNRVKLCEWILAIAFPKAELEQIYRQQNSTKVTIILISVLSLGIFVFLEMSLLDYFYKNQLVNAVYDPLTNLYSRQFFEKIADRQLKKNPRVKFMLIEADIRGFKFINQNYGEENADKMIFYFSTLLNKAVHSYKGLICRGYADHFYIMLEIRNVYKAMSQFRKKLEKLNDLIKTYEIPFFPKFGITFFRPEQKRTVSVKELIGQASFAKSTIKDNMILPYAIYNSRLLDKVNEEHYIEATMEKALENGEFFVMYQPKILLADDKIVGGEALVRWKTNDIGVLTPDKFIPLFERNGFITKLDFYVYEQVFKFISRLLKENQPVVPISVNMSRNHNKPDKFMHDFMELFNKYDIPPEYIQVEIIERSVMDSGTLCEITDRLHEKGFSVAMDDFGSGESSLNMLTKVPVDVLKFDRYFLLSTMNEKGAVDEKSARFMSSLIELSRNLEKQTVFEGVETEEQRDFLKKIRCDQVQGYFYSKPLLENEFLDFIKKHSGIVLNMDSAEK